MPRRKAILRGLVITLAALHLCFAENPLRSPWDASAVKLSNAPYSCPEPPHLSSNLTTSGFYSDNKSSIIDPAKWSAYQKSAGPVKSLGNEAVAAADAFQTSGSREAVECVLRLETTAARERALTGEMSSNQAYFVQGWVIGALGIALLKVRPSGLLSVGDTRLLTEWMKNVSRQTMAFYERRDEATPHHYGNNHLYWAGVQMAAVGIAANDRTMFNWALDAYRNGVQQITPLGTLPLEMRRGRRALHYHLYACAPLVYLAEFGEDNGIDLYAEDHAALRRLVNRSIAGLSGSGYFDRVTGIRQDLPAGPPSAEAISWGQVYIHRFSDSAISRLLSGAHSLSYMYLGGLPPY